jgi:TolB-like protein
MLGPYTILGEVGRGGMGEVYRARDSRLDRDVAVKVLPENLARDPVALRRFEHEAKAIAALSHPNILAIFDFGHEAGVLAAAHGKDVIHRDLKPENLFLTGDTRGKILDFGLAKRATMPDADDQVTATQHTMAGSVVGTMGYMAPEQLRGHAVDPRADIFAFGVVLYEMLSGRRPFGGDSVADTIGAVLKEQPAALSGIVADVLPSLEALVQRCLAKSAEERVADADELVALLRSSSQPDAIAAPSPPRPASLAVLPFRDLSEKRDQAYFCEGMAEELMHGLVRLHHLRVVSRTSAFQFDRGTDVREIGRLLAVDSVLEGSVRAAGGRLRVTVQLVSVADGCHLRTLDPLSKVVQASLGLVHYFDHRFDEAIRELRALESGFAILHLFLGRALVETGRHDEATAALERAAELSDRSAESVASEGHAAARRGDTAAAERALAELDERAGATYVAPSLRAQVLAGLDRADVAAEALERAFDEHAVDMAWLGVRPVFAGMRRLPRVVSLLERMGLAGPG